jgi:hypothetical protein
VISFISAGSVLTDCYFSINKKRELYVRTQTIRAAPEGGDFTAIKILYPWNKNFRLFDLVPEHLHAQIALAVKTFHFYPVCSLAISIEKVK